MTKVKICGITSLDDAIATVDEGADMIGFNFYRGSKRFIEPNNARKIIDALTRDSGHVGVFVNESINEVVRIVDEVGLDGIQLHGGESNEYVADLMKRTSRFVIKAFRVSSTFAFEKALDSSATYVMLDGYSLHELGGTGVVADWNVATKVVFCRPEAVYLAGGLTPENVAEAIRVVKPHAVDVASGVESSPGRKDPDKVAAFIKAAKAALL